MLRSGREIKSLLFIPVFAEGLSKVVDMKIPLDKERAHVILSLSTIWVSPYSSVKGEEELTPAKSHTSRACCPT